MKVTGEATLHAPVERVWEALLDPTVLVRTIPGCQQLAVVGEDEYRMTVTAGVAAVKGTYAGTVRLTDQQRPASFVLRAAGAGAPGTVQVDVTVRLAEGDAGATLLTYDADAVVGGPVGGVGQRMLTGVARKTAGEFFRAVDAALNPEPGGGPTVPDRSPPPERPGGTPGSKTVGRLPASGALPPSATTGSSAGQTVFTRPSAAAGAGGVQPLVPAAAVGAAIALIGVAIGARIARRR